MVWCRFLVQDDVIVNNVGVHATVRTSASLMSGCNVVYMAVSKVAAISVMSGVNGFMCNSCVVCAEYISIY